MSEIKNDVEIKHEMRPPDNNVTSMSRAERRSEYQYISYLKCRNEIIKLFILHVYAIYVNFNILNITF